MAEEVSREIIEEVVEDVFDNQAWRRAADTLKHAGNHVLLPVDVQLSVGPEFGWHKPTAYSLSPSEIVRDEEEGEAARQVVNTPDISEYGSEGNNANADTADKREKRIADPIGLLESEEDEEVESNDLGEEDEDEDSLEYRGLVWLDAGALQSCIADGFDNLLRNVYLLGRLDQRADFEGSDAKRFIDAHQLGEVAMRASKSPQYLEGHARHVLENAVANHGSLLDAVTIKKSDDADGGVVQ